MYAAAIFSAIMVTAVCGKEMTIDTFLSNKRKMSTRGAKLANAPITTLKKDATVGFVEVREYVTADTCDGSYVTNFMEYGNCLETMNNQFSKTDVSGAPTDAAYYFNRTYYSDGFCETPTGEFDTYLLPTTCESKTDDFYADDGEAIYGTYVVGLSTKLSISRKTFGYISWNTAETCDNAKEKEAIYMTALNFKSCYPNPNANLTYESDDFYNGDDNMTAYGSMIVDSCNKARYFMNDDCSGESIKLKNTIGEDDDAAMCTFEDGDEMDAEQYSTYFCKSKNDGRRNVCFAGSETILTESGVTKMISEVAIGDRVQVYSPESASMEFSEVIAVPHAKNNVLATFVQITTASSSVKMTPDHLVAAGACSTDAAMLPLVRAETVQAGDCVHTSAGKSMVSAVKTVEEEGIYTFVTRAEFIVVGDIVASPFAVNHKILNFFYNIHRALPTNSPLVEIFHAVADQITKIAVLPGVMSLFAVSA